MDSQHWAAATAAAAFVGGYLWKTSSPASPASPPSPVNFDPMDTILVILDTYRHPQCVETLNSIFEAAECPKSVSVALVQEHAKNDPDIVGAWKAAFPDLPRDRLDRVRVQKLRARDTAGPAAARAHAERTMYNGERYCLFVRPGVILAPRWDTICLTALARLGPRSVISMPCGDKEENIRFTIVKSNRNSSNRNNSRLTSNWPLHVYSATMHSLPRPNSAPQHVPWMHDDFQFSSAEVLKSVPHSLHLPFLREMEYIAMHSVMLHLAQWQVYQLPRAVAWMLPAEGQFPHFMEFANQSSHHNDYHHHQWNQLCMRASPFIRWGTQAGGIYSHTEAGRQAETLLKYGSFKNCQAA